MKFKTYKNKIIAIFTAMTMLWLATALTWKYGIDELSAYAAGKAMSGDLNGDGIIDFCDLVVFRNSLLKEKPLSANIADLNGDGAVNQKDLNELQDYLLRRREGFSGDVKKTFASIERSFIMKTIDNKDITAIEIQMTAEMAELANTLKTPQEVYLYVQNNVNTEFYYGSRKGAIGVYEQNSGNDFDQASFLIAIFRYLGYTANYGIAEVVLTDADLCGMTKTTNIDAAKRIFTNQGRKLENYGAGKYKTEQTFVVLDLNGNIFLAPSFKYYKLRDNAADLGKIIDGLGSQYNPDGGNVNFEDITAIENSLKGQTLADVFPRYEIVEQDLVTVLPYEVPSGEYTQYTAIPAEKCDWVKLSLGNNQLLSYRSAYFYGKDLTIEYKLTEEAQFFLEEYGFNIRNITDLTGLLGTYRNRAQIYASIKLDGKEITGGSSNLLGSKENLKLNIRSGGTTYDLVKELTYGAVYSIILDYQVISPHDIAAGYAKLPQNTAAQSKINADNVFGSAWLENTLTLLGKSYFSQIDTNNAIIAEASDIHCERSLSAAVVDFTPDIYTKSGENVLNKRGSIGIDVIGNETEFVSRLNKRDEESKIRHSTGFLSSYYESEVIKQFTGLQAVSTAEVLSRASEQGVEILFLSKANISELNASKLSAKNKADITKLINEGKYVTVPSEEIRIDDWSGTGYIVYDPATDLSQHIINNNLNGGKVCSWVGLAHLCDILAAIVECILLFSLIVMGAIILSLGVGMALAAIGGFTVAMGISIGAWAATLSAGTAIAVTTGLGLGTIALGGWGLKNVAGGLYNSVELMNAYLDGNTAAGNALKTKSAWHVAGVGVAVFGGKALSAPLSNLTSKVHLDINIGYPIASPYAVIPSGYSQALDVYNGLLDAGFSKATTEIALSNTNAIGYTPAIIYALTSVDMVLAEQFVKVVAGSAGNEILNAVGGSGPYAGDVIRGVATYGMNAVNVFGAQGVESAPFIAKYGKNVFDAMAEAHGLAVKYKESIKSLPGSDKYNPGAVCVAIDLKNPDIKGYAGSGIYDNNPTIENLPSIPSEGYIEYYRNNFIPDNVSPSIKAELVKLQARIKYTKDLAAEADLFYDHPPLPREGSFYPGKDDGRTVDNCAEIWAARDAILQGAKVEDLAFHTINSKNLYFTPCNNCKHTFQGLLFIKK